MKHPSYLRVDDRAVFKIHGLHFFIKDCGGTKQAHEWIETLRRIAREQGAGELAISAGVGPAEMPDDASVVALDFVTTIWRFPRRRCKPNRIRTPI